MALLRGRLSRRRPRPGPKTSRPPPLAPSSRPSSRRSRARLSARSAAFLSVAAAPDAPPPDSNEERPERGAEGVPERGALAAEAHRQRDAHELELERARERFGPFRRHARELQRVAFSSRVAALDGVFEKRPGHSEGLPRRDQRALARRRGRRSRRNPRARANPRAAPREGRKPTRPGPRAPRNRRASRNRRARPSGAALAARAEGPQQGHDRGAVLLEQGGGARTSPRPRARGRAAERGDEGGDPPGAPSVQGTRGRLDVHLVLTRTPTAGSSALRRTRRRALPESAGVFFRGVFFRRGPRVARLGLGPEVVARLRFFRSSSSSLSSRSRAAASWLTSVAAAVHTPSSRIAKMVSSRRSGRAARIARAPRRGTTAASGALPTLPRRRGVQKPRRRLPQERVPRGRTSRRRRDPFAVVPPLERSLRSLAAS